VPNALPGLQQLMQRVAESSEIKWLVALLIVLIGARYVARFLRKPSREPQSRSSFDLDLTSIERALADAVRFPLRVYHLPVRLGLVVVAPLGHEAGVVDVDAIPDLLDQAVPGLGKVQRELKAKTWVWPVQMSANGFRHALTAHLRVEGKDVKGSRWCLVTGRVVTQDHQYMWGLGLYSHEPNNLGCVAVESEFKWLDVVRFP